MGDDLLLTNKYVQDEYRETSNNITFNKLESSKQTAKNRYDENAPSFTEEIKVNTETGISVPESSVAFEQFVKFAETEKRKKIKRTIVNIDSKNRRTEYKFDKKELSINSLSNFLPIFFVNNSNIFTIKLDKLNMVSDIKFYNQLIFLNLLDDEFKNVGINKSNFEFNFENGKPIFSIVKFINNNGITRLENADTYNENNKEYEFNEIEVKIPSNIDPNEIKTCNVGTGSKINIITNVKISYPTPSHYKIDLGDTYSNIYSIRLISSEIPNTSYTFNENLIESNFGQFNIKTKINNKLRWVNKSDLINTINYNVNTASTVREGMPIITPSSNKEIHNENHKRIKEITNTNLHNTFIKVATKENIVLPITDNIVDEIGLNNNDFIILKNQSISSENGIYKYTLDNNNHTYTKILDIDYVSKTIDTNTLNYIYRILEGSNKGKYYKINIEDSVYTFTELDYISNLKRINTLLRISLSDDQYNSNINIKNRDYYIDNKYLGDFILDGNNLIGLSQNTETNIENTIHCFTENLLYRINNDLEGFKYFLAYFNSDYNEPLFNNRGYVHIKFIDYYQFEIKIFGNNTSDVIPNVFSDLEMPYKVIFNSTNSELKYIFTVYEKSELDVEAGSTEIKRYLFRTIPISTNNNQYNIPFGTLENEEILVTVCNEFKQEIIDNFNKYNTNLYNLITNYYTNTNIISKPHNNIWSNSLKLYKLKGLNELRYYQGALLTQDNTGATGYILNTYEGSSPVIILEGEQVFNTTDSITMSTGKATKRNIPTPIVVNIPSNITNGIEISNICDLNDFGLNFSISFKKYYRFTFSNKNTVKQVKREANYLLINQKDSNGDIISDLHSIVKDYRYIQINNRFFLADISESVELYKDSTEIYYKILLEDNWRPSLDNMEILDLSFQKYDLSEIEYIYTMSEIDNTILRIYESDNNISKTSYIELFIGSKRIFNHNSVESIIDSNEINNNVIILTKENGDIKVGDIMTSQNIIWTSITDGPTVTNVNGTKITLNKRISINKYDKVNFTSNLGIANKYYAEYKYNSENYDLFSTTKKELKLFNEELKVYLRESMGDYVITSLENHEYNSDNSYIDNVLKGIKADNINDSTEFVFNDQYTIAKNLEKYLDKSNILSDLVDTCDFNITSIYKKNSKTGIQEISFAKEFIPEDSIKSLDSFDIMPKVNSSTNKIGDYFNINNNSEGFYIENLKSIDKYPVYELNIASGKYSADSIVKYLLAVLGSLKSRAYDYSKGIFYTDSKFQKYIDINNEYGINQECKFTISVNKSVNSITFKQYKKIFDSHQNTSTEKSRVLYYNEGFPYINLKIPQISVPNNTIIYTTGFASTDNIPGSSLNGEKLVVIPMNYKIKVRQILPLPKLDYLNSKQNLFTNEGYIDEPDDEIYNKFVDYINSSINSSSVKNLAIDFIVNRIFKVRESSYLNNDLSNSKFKNMENAYNKNSLSTNKGSFYKGDLERSFIDNYGNNIKYPRVDGYNDKNYAVASESITGVEYLGQSFINGYRNEHPHKEYDDDSTPNRYNDKESTGLEPLYIKNELFMKLKDINTTYKDNIIGRITNLDKRIDKYGNFEVDYDLFTENYMNFNIGDIIIGLDSNTIGIILPYDYNFNRLPNIDMVSIGIGSYLLNRSIDESRHFFDRYLSISDNTLLTRDLAKTFIRKLSEWQIEKNNTHSGIYIYSRTVPNKSRLEGSVVTNLQVYQPNFFKFLEDEDTALDKFGFKNSYYNNKWDYFKTNYETNKESEVKRSFFNTARNNELYSDYIIVETKSQSEFNVNDRVYIENHNIINKDSDFKREKFFNIDLIESYENSISKLESIYNTTVLNYNGKKGTGTLNKSDYDNEFLKDSEYKYIDTENNDNAKATVVLNSSISSASISNQVDNSSSGNGYVGIPKITVSEPDTEITGNKKAEIYASQIENGIIKDTLVYEKGLYYRDKPTINIESMNETAVGYAVNTESEQISEILLEGENIQENNNNNVNVSFSRGKGYTEAPSIIASSSGIQALGTVSISGIGTITPVNTIDDLVNEAYAFNIDTDTYLKSWALNSANNKEWLEISAPSDGIAAEAYIKRNGVTFDSVVVTTTGRGYSQSDLIVLTHYYFDSAGAQVSSTEHFVAQIDAIGTVSISVSGSNYDISNPPKMSVIRNDISQMDGQDAIITAIVEVGKTSLNITEMGLSSVIHGGSGYKISSTGITGASLVIDPPRAIIESELNMGIIDVLIGGIKNVNIVDKGTGYSETDILVFTGGKTFTKNYVEPKGYPIIIDGKVENIVLTSYGNGYFEVPTISIKKQTGEDSDGTGFDGKCNNVNDTLLGNPGSNYDLSNTSIEVSEIATGYVYKTIGNIPNQTYYEGMVFTQANTNAVASIIQTKYISSSEDELFIKISSNTFNETDVITLSKGTSSKEITINQINSPFSINNLIMPFISNTTEYDIVNNQNLNSRTSVIMKGLIRNSGIFTSIPQITITSSSGSSAELIPIIGNIGTLKDPTIIYQGMGYSKNPSITISPPKKDAVVKLDVNDNRINNIILSEMGSGYTIQPNVTLNSNNYSNIVSGLLPEITAKIGYGFVESVKITAKGTGYFDGATVEFSDPDIPDTDIAIKATGKVIVTKSTSSARSNVVGIEILNPGYGYTKPPRITISNINDNGSGATAISLINNGKVKIEHNNLIGMILNDTENNNIPKISIDSPYSNAILDVSMNGKIDFVKIDDKGNNYIETPQIHTSSDDSNIITTPILNATVSDEKIVDINVSDNNTGEGYSKTPSIYIEKSNDNKIDIPFKNNNIYRHFSHDSDNYDINLYLTYEEGTGSSSGDTRFKIEYYTNNGENNLAYVYSVNVGQNNILSQYNEENDLQTLEINQQNNKIKYVKNLSFVIISNIETTDSYVKGDIITQYLQKSGNELEIAKGKIVETTNNSQTIIVEVIGGKFMVNSDNLYILKKGVNIISNNSQTLNIYNSVYKSVDSLTSGLSVDQKYNISLKVYRLPIVVNKLGKFDKNKYSLNNDLSNYVEEYSTLGIFERLIDEQMNHIVNNMKYNLIKASELYRTYSYNLFKNRIIKLRVCPIDDKGFCFESVNSSNIDKLTGKATSSNLENRTVKGFSKKLFPYHEYDIIKTYLKTENGSKIDITGVPYKGFRRPHQDLSNKDYSSKEFLPGMGVYIINENPSTNVYYSTDHYNNKNNFNPVPLVYSEYRYESDFIGYVLGTSLNPHQYSKECTLNSDSFSNVNSEDSVSSEYYIYMLIDPDINSKEGIDKLFDKLNKDNINIVFDASANKDYTEDEPLKQNGYLSSKNSYYIDSNNSVPSIKSDNSIYDQSYKTKSDDKMYVINKNIYGNTAYLDETDNIILYEDTKYSEIISSTSLSTTPEQLSIENAALSARESAINTSTHDALFKNYDGFNNLIASSIKIVKNKLNKTLPYYTFQKRLACATIIGKSVCYERKNDVNSRKLFLSGDYDYFFNDFLKNKMTLRFKTFLDKNSLDILNKNNTIISNTININTKEFNKKETNSHSGVLDPNVNKSDDFYKNPKYSNLEFTEIDGNNPIINLESGDDILLVDSLKSKYSYDSGPNYKDAMAKGDSRLGLTNSPLKVLCGSFLPQLYFNHNNKYNSLFNNYLNNMCVLDKEYNSQLERITYNAILGKYKTKKINILANNSEKYSQNNEKDVNDYNKVIIRSLNEISGISQLTISNLVGNITLSNQADTNRLKDCMIVISSNIQSKNEKQPFDKNENTELGIIDSAVLNNDSTITITLKNKLVKTHDINQEDLQFAFILYPTLTSTDAMLMVNENKYAIPVNVSENNNIRFDNVEIGDIIIIDWGVKRKIVKNKYPPHSIHSINNTRYDEVYTTQSYRIVDIDQTQGQEKIYIETPYIDYSLGSSIILLKNPLVPSLKNMTHNFLSTQPFTINNKWYTKIFYKGLNTNIGKHINKYGIESKVINNIDNKYIQGGLSHFNKNYAGRVFIGGMKGITIPFIDFNTLDSNKYLGNNTGIEDFMANPFSDGYYTVYPTIKEDFMTDKNTKNNYIKQKGTFNDNLSQINNIENDDININNILENKWYDINDEKDYPYIVIEGFYLGYGGFIEERYNEDIINTILNNDLAFSIKKITNVGNKDFIYLQFNSIYNDTFVKGNLEKNGNLINQSTRNVYLDYENNLFLLDNIFRSKKLSEYQPHISVFGEGGRIITKKIKSPYDLNPDNYIYMTIPSLSHIKSIQNSKIDDTFAKIILPGDSNNILYNSFVAGTKIFYNNLFNNLSELEVTFITNEGFLFDFNGSEHSFTLEITEIIDKFEYINPRYGNIEI